MTDVLGALRRSRTPAPEPKPSADTPLRAFHDGTRDYQEITLADWPEYRSRGYRQLAPHERREDLPAFPGGAVGFFGYDLVRTVEPLGEPNPDPLGLPDMALMVCELMLVFDHMKHELSVVGFAFDGDEERAARLIRTAREALARPVPAERSTRDAPPTDFRSNMTREQFEANVARIVEYVHAGDLFQVNLAQRLLHKARCSAAELALHLRTTNPAPFAGYADFGRVQVVSTSPERFLTLQKGQIETRPIKGTRPRMSDPVADQGIAQLLRHSPKDRSENVMIVDLLRNDLSRVAEAGSVRVENAFAVESYPTVHQMVTTVRARLAEGRGPMELLTALFPCGSITGAPKIRAMELITGVERDARGPYCGAIGRIDASGDAAFNVAIRTLRLSEIENARGKAELGVGGAIVAGSDARTEWREALTKGAFARASGPEWQAPAVDLIETMLFEPRTGIAELEAHITRMRDSAAVLGIGFDRHEARNQIQALCFDLEGPACVRLMASRGGALALEARPLPPQWPNPARAIVLPLPVDPGDWRLRHKSSDRGFYEDARRAALAVGADEAIFVRDDGLVTEGTITNVFVERDGMLLTPPAAIGLLPGVLRGLLLTGGKAREEELTIADLEGGFLLGNALRGLMPVRLS